MSERDVVTLLFTLSAMIAILCVALAFMGQWIVAVSLAVVALSCTIIGFETRKNIKNG